MQYNSRIFYGPGRIRHGPNPFKEGKLPHRDGEQRFRHVSQTIAHGIHGFGLFADGFRKIRFDHDAPARTFGQFVAPWLYGIFPAGMNGRYGQVETQHIFRVRQGSSGQSAQTQAATARVTISFRMSDLRTDRNQVRPECSSGRNPVLGGLKQGMQRKFKTDDTAPAGHAATAAMPAFVGECHARSIRPHFQNIARTTCKALLALDALCFVKNRRHIFFSSD